MSKTDETLHVLGETIHLSETSCRFYDGYFSCVPLMQKSSLRGGDRPLPTHPPKPTAKDLERADKVNQEYETLIQRLVEFYRSEQHPFSTFVPSFLKTGSLSAANLKKKKYILSRVDLNGSFHLETSSKASEFLVATTPTLYLALPQGTLESSAQSLAEQKFAVEFIMAMTLAPEPLQRELRRKVSIDLDGDLKRAIKTYFSGGVVSWQSLGAVSTFLKNPEEFEKNTQDLLNAEVFVELIKSAKTKGVLPQKLYERSLLQNNSQAQTVLEWIIFGLSPQVYAQERANISKSIETLRKKGHGIYIDSTFHKAEQLLKVSLNKSTNKK